MKIKPKLFHSGKDNFPSRLRGLCAYSDIDTIYTPKNYGKDGELMFVG